MTQAFDVRWLRDVPDDVQREYFKVRHQCYLERWASRLELEEGIGLRDEFDDGDVVVALGSRGEVLGGVRANVIRPRDDPSPRLLPLERSWNLCLQELFPEHPLRWMNYAEASKLFLSPKTSRLSTQIVTLKMLGFLLDNVPDVGVTYFGMPFSLLRIYRLLAQLRGIEYVVKEVDGLRPYSGAAENGSLRWGVFACLLSTYAER